MPTNLYELFGAMRCSDTPFYATGDCYFVNRQPVNYWDFFTANVSGQIHRLTTWGFERVLLPRHRDDTTIGVFVNQTLSVRVEMVAPLRVYDKLKARNALQALGVWSNDRDTMCAIWNAPLSGDGVLFGLTNRKAVDLLMAKSYPAMFAFPINQ